MATKEEIDQYRSEVQRILAQHDDRDQDQLKAMLDSFSDEDLAFGMPFTSAEELADILLNN